MVAARGAAVRAGRAGAPAPAGRVRRARARAADPMEDKLGQLKQLGELKDQGILTQAEFDAQKAKILAG